MPNKSYNLAHKNMVWLFSELGVLHTYITSTKIQISLNIHVVHVKNMNVITVL